jgi:primosomal protein N' (replication factor Y)
METRLFELEKQAPNATGTALYAQVLVNVTARTLQDRIFTYLIPDEFQSVARIGQPVLVPFGAQTDLTGFIVDLRDMYEGRFKLREITDILDEQPLFDAEYYDFIRWVSEYYATPIPQVLDVALPANLVQKARKVVFAGATLTDPIAVRKVQHEKNGRKALELVEFLYRNTPSLDDPLSGKGYTPRYLAGKLRLPTKAINQLLARLRALGMVTVETELRAKTAAKTIRKAFPRPEAETVEKLTARQREIVAYLRDQPEGVPVQQVVAELGTTPETLKRLENLGALRIAEVQSVRDPLSLYKQLQENTHFKLSAYQQAAMDVVIAGDSSAPYLLYGITGSGKTEVYMSLARHMLENGQSVLVMVPEIALTSQIARRFIAHFGSENIALWHSNLSDGEKADTWQKLNNGELKILIGARSAVWAPMKRLGLIMIDEEHESSYKQDSPAPRYNAKTLAMELARRTGARLVLGSATPEVAVFYEAKAGKRILHLPERFGGRQLAKVSIVDMKRERAQGNRNQLSHALDEELLRNLETGEQSIILLNRRGFYTTIQCTTCDYIFMCPDCDVAVTFHRTRNMVCCHYCGHEGERPQYCPVCAGMELSHSGVGTQRIEDELVRKFPEARVLRLDSDVMQRKHAHREIFEAFSAGEGDILVGTQIVAKGLDVGNVTLVGVVSADSAFALPDYKSAERGFQLLTQVAGRAGRGDKPGRVVIQAVQTQHMVLLHTEQQDYDSFYDEEIRQREALGFPPFSQLFRFIVSCENEKKGQQFIQAAAMHLRESFAQAGLEKQIQLMGPAPCVLPRIQARYRFHLLVKSFAGEPGRQVVADFYRQALSGGALPEDINFILDIDAQSLL